MIRPRPRPTIPGSTARQHRYAPSTLTSNTRHQSAGSSSQIGSASDEPVMPALLTSTSMGPSSRSTRATMRPTESSSATSASTATPPTSFATPSICSRDRAATATFIPAAASSIATLSPIPRPPPVTSATCPASSDFATASQNTQAGASPLERARASRACGRRPGGSERVPRSARAVGRARVCRVSFARAAPVRPSSGRRPRRGERMLGTASRDLRLSLAICLAVVGGLAVASPSVVLAEEITASIKTFTAKPIPDAGGTCRSCGGAFHLELEYVLGGEGYGATPSNPKGGVPPVSAVKLYLPAGMREHPAAFGQCTEATIENVGPSGCPANSVAGEEGRVSVEVTFGSNRVPEQGTLQPFFGPKGLLFFAHGSSPVNLEIVWGGAFSSSHQPPYEEQLLSEIPAIATVPGAPLASFDSIHLKLGASSTNGGEVDPFLTLPTTCPGPGFPFKTEVVFGGMNGGGHEFQIPAKTVMAT